MKRVLLLGVVLLLCLAYLSITAEAEDGEVFEGQKKISSELNALGSIGGYVVVWEVMGGHADEMHNIMVNKMEIDPENIRMVDWWDGFEVLFEPGMLVINSSTTWNCHPQEYEIQRIQRGNSLFVCAAGNVPQYGVTTRDLYTPDNPSWDHPVYERWKYKNTMSLLNTGKVILATAVLKDGETYNISQHTVRCDNAKEYCFSVPFEYGEGVHTSGAAARLSALSFYLRQLWDTPEEVIDVLRKTAIDIGDPGVDGEFGWGVPNVDHTIVRAKAAEKVAQSLLLPVSEDLLLTEALQEGDDVPAKHTSPFTPSYKVGEGSQEICITYNRERNRVMFGFGSAVSPFGVSSPLFGKQQKPVVQLAVQRLLLDGDAHNLSVFAQYGQSTGEDYAVRNGRIGLNYQTQFGTTAHLSLYAGYRQVWGSVGIPGYEAVGVGQTSFVKHLGEVHTSFNWSF